MAWRHLRLFIGHDPAQKSNPFSTWRAGEAAQYKRFKDDRKSIADDSRSGRPLTSTTDRNIGQVRDLIVADKKITIDNISEILGILYGSFQKTYW
ncbi:hypothetical protein LAZ67_4003949 [Cordylochernes scorpioides]|uniref:Uncharacterized protein n=1 Tax=Cordylochernes scorpioides TaxID=51811 RepID=A0ABY6KF53_9ARAC|nr:hypothetical protein LAZ67_4003949 [Cordylochernes scorpioides]